MHHGRRAVRDRPPAVPRSARAHARRVPRRDRATPGSPRDDIDGLVDLPGTDGHAAGFTGAGAYDVMDALRLELRLVRQRARDVGPARFGDQRVPARSRPGSRTTCSASASVYEGSAQGDKGRAGGHAGRWRRAAAASRPAGSWSGTCRSRAPSAAIWIAMFAQRHFHEYGTTREQLAWIALNARRNAALNPKAIYRDPMSMDDYMAARMISTPFCLYDCDVPCDGATAVIVSPRRRGRRTCASRRSRRGRRARASTAGRRGTSSTTSSTMANRDAARADVGAHRSEAGRRADGASSTTASRSSRCRGSRRSASAAWARAGRSSRAATRIARDGELPLNTHGGQLSAGRLHGYGFLHEARHADVGRGRRPPDRRRRPRSASSAAGGGNTCGCLLLVRE